MNLAEVCCGGHTLGILLAPIKRENKIGSQATRALTILSAGVLWVDMLVEYALFDLQNYLTDVWNLSFTHAAAILNISGGMSLVLLPFCFFLVEEYLGSMVTLVLSFIPNTVGLGFITMSMPPVLANSMGNCKQYEPECIGHTQKVLLYAGMALLVVGKASKRASLYNFSVEHTIFGKDPWRTKIQLRSGSVTVSLIGSIALPYIKKWSLRFGIPAIFNAYVTIFLFVMVCQYLRKGELQGSPLTSMCRVFVAAAFKKSQPLPPHATQLYKGDQAPHTASLRCLEKAAIILPDVSLDDQVDNRWRLCSLAEVEDTKTAVRMVPMWMTFIICATVSSVGNTYFVEQANHMNRKIGKWKVPIQVLLLLFGLAKFIFSLLLSLILKKKKYGPPLGIGLGMIFSILCCTTAAKIEIRRLEVIRSHGLLDKPDEEIPMSIFWLLFQFVLLAGLDSFVQKGAIAFFKYQSPKSMQDYLSYFAKGVSGLGFMFSVLLVHVVGKISGRGGRANWFQYTLNKSRLDRYYWVLAALSGANLIVFVLVAWRYKYKEPEEADDEEADDAAESNIPSIGDVKSLFCCR